MNISIRLRLTNASYPHEYDAETDQYTTEQCYGYIDHEVGRNGEGMR